MKPLTEKQKSALLLINDHIEKNGFSPSYRDLCNLMGYKAIGSAQDLIRSLKTKGYLDDGKKNVARCLSLTELAKETLGLVDSNPVEPPPYVENFHYSVPCIGSVPAGNPIEAIENPIGNLSISSDLISSEPSKSNPIFALQADGQSMIEAGILSGDWLIVRFQQNASLGDIVIAKLDEDATVKRFMKDNKLGYYLKAENPRFDNIYAKDTPFTIVGKVIGLQRSI